MKIAGKMTPDGTTYVYEDLTFTSGMMGTDGTVTDSSSYQYSNKISVGEGDIIYAVNGLGNNEPSRIVTCYSNGSAVSASGRNTGGMTSDPFTVPSGIDEIILTVQNNTAKKAKILPAVARAVGIKVLPDGTVPVSLGGDIPVKHVWETEYIYALEDYELRDANTHEVPESQAVDVSGYGIISLRIINTLDVPVTLGFYTDHHLTRTRYMADAEGIPIAVEIQPNTYIQMITPDDIPQLNYIRYLRVYLKANTAPTSGNVNLWFALKR